ncbi:hypothetical protein SAMN06265377_0546 [Flagellimonas pacifica]|uniref:Uncharacterized protein n=1 Tax=Flagellimonas pacifica TaxID=1247520 RepID=A0A285MCJ0_9FLAO|nr:hypothetical protein SAMN06265377_0546 [Allomuricauda parva]
MSFFIYLFFLILGLVLWGYGFFIVNKRKQLIRYAIVNTAILIVYSILWLNHSKIITGHDEYGLGFLFGYPLIPVIHSILVFFIILLTIKKGKNNYR